VLLGISGTDSQQSIEFATLDDEDTNLNDDGEDENDMPEANGVVKGDKNCFLQETRS